MPTIEVMLPEDVFSALRKSPREVARDVTLRSVLAVFLFHQAYHTGQTGILRRIAGKEGVIS